MGLFQSVMSTIGVSSVITPYLKKGFDWIMNSEWGQSAKAAIKDMVDDKVGDYASKIESDKWTNMVLERVNLEGLTEEQLDSYSTLANSFSEVVSNSKDDWTHITNSIAEYPAEWGVYLSNHNVTAEKIAEMQEAIASGKDISGYDMLKLTWSNSSLKTEAEKSEEKTSDAPSEGNTSKDDEPATDAASTEKSDKASESLSLTGNKFIDSALGSFLPDEAESAIGGIKNIADELSL